MQAKPLQASASAGDISLGMEVVVVKRVTLNFPVFGDPDFRKDLRVGTQGKVLEVSKDSKKNKVQAHVMHHGEPAVAFDWVVVTNLRPVKEDTEPLSSGSKPVPDEICKGHQTDKKCEWVEDWPTLVEDEGPIARFHYVKGLTAVAMGLVHQRMPTYSEKGPGCDPSVEPPRRQNHRGVDREELRPWSAHVLPCDRRDEDADLYA